MRSWIVAAVVAAVGIGAPATAHAKLWLTTTASDAAVTVRVADVRPGGEVRALTTGWRTASLRATDPGRARVVRGQVLQPWHPFTKASVLPVRAGDPTEVDVEVFPTTAVLRKGHRLRVTVDPADVPHQVPTLPALARRLGGRVAVLTDPQHASRIVLPVVGDTCAVPVRKAKQRRKKRRAAKRRAVARAACAPLPVPDLTRGW